MANKIQIRRGLKANLPVLSAGELGFPTDTRELYIGTGSGNVNMGGSHWYRGTAMSGTSTTANAYSYAACPEVKLDDIYMNTSNGNIYACTTAGKGTAAKWTYQGCIKGEKGDTGATGANGADGVDGADGASVTVDSILSISSENPVRNRILTCCLRLVLQVARGTSIPEIDVSSYNGYAVSDDSLGEGWNWLRIQNAPGAIDTFICPIDNLYWCTVTLIEGTSDTIDKGETAYVLFSDEKLGDGSFKAYVMHI